MEVAGLVIGIVSLYSASQSCYTLFSEAKDSVKSATVAAHELEIHASILKAWAFYWEISPALTTDTGDQDENDPPKTSVKLEQYLKRNPVKAVGISRALHCIGDALSDRKKLLDTYGLELKLVDNKDPVAAFETNRLGSRSFKSWSQLKSDIEARAKEIASRTSQTRRIAWALKDSAKFQALLGDLKKYNDSLHMLSPESAFELLQISLALEYLPRHDATELKRLRDSPSSQAQTSNEEDTTGDSSDKPVKAEVLFMEEGNHAVELGWEVSPTQQGVQLIADLTDLKLEVSLSTDVELTEHEEARLLSIDQHDLELADVDAGEMAVWISQRKTVFIERHSYALPPDQRGDIELRRRIRSNIIALGRLLKLSVCVKRLYSLQVAGMVEFPEQESIGIVFELPGTLGHYRKGFPVHDMTIRRPREALMAREGDPDPSLGHRFELARNLVQSVSFLHACGWLHKNIRTEVMYFFPKDDVARLSREWDNMDYAHPYFLGYCFSRPDDAKHEQRRSGELLPDGAGPLLARVVIPQITPVIQVEDLEDSRSNHSRLATRQPEISAYLDDLDKDPHKSLNMRRISPQAHRVNLDMKHHPLKRTHPERRYCHAFDVYSLGIALFEIGLWKSVGTIVRDAGIDRHTEPFDMRREIIGLAQRLLPSTCGETYAKVTVACLEVDAEDTETDLVEQRSLCARVAADLAHCRA